MNKARKLAALEAELEQDLTENVVDSVSNVEVASNNNDVVVYKGDGIKAEQAADLEAELEQELAENVDEGAANVEAAYSNDAADYKDGAINAKQAAGPPPRISKTNSSAAATRDKWGEIAEEMYSMRSNDLTSNLLWVTRTIEKYDEPFAPLLELCPNLDFVLGHLLILRLGVRVQEVSWTSDMKEWSGEDCKRIGRSIATLIRWVQTGHASVDAWRKHYPQLNSLFQAEGDFEKFMVVITSNLLRDNRFGMMFRVGVGAALSTIDAATDIYLISTYYQVEELERQTNALIAMIVVNMSFQLLLVLGQYSKKSWGVKLKEATICLLFLRPAVDAYRVSTNHHDPNSPVDSLTEVRSKTK